MIEYPYILSDRRQEMNLDEKVQLFRSWLERMAAYRMALTIIGVDKTAKAPSQGADYRNRKTALLSGELIRIQNDPEMYQLMEELSEEELDPETARMVELQLKSARRIRAVPADEYVEYQKILGESEEAWLKAKAAKDYSMYEPYLAKLVKAYSSLKQYQKSDLSLFDRILDENQPGWTSEKYDALFEQIRDRLVPLIRRVSAAEPIDTSFMHAVYPAEKQRVFMKRILEYIDFNETWGKISESEHPVTTGVCSGDIRFTTKYREYNPGMAVLSTVHESGHAYYTHQMDPSYSGTPLAHVSAGMQESQSRFCENHLARTLPFWQVHYPALKELFPEQLEGIDAETFWRALNESHAGCVRMDADELTYPLHIMIRYEIEKELFAGTLDTKDLNRVWNRKYKEYLGVDVPDDEKGILQDMHWPYALFGYFPTYTLGSAFAAQFDHTVRQELDTDALIKEGRYTEIMTWLKDHLHHYGNMYEADELIRMATGEPFNVSYYLDYLEDKYTRLYDLK